MAFVEHTLPPPVHTEYPKYAHKDGKSVIVYSAEEEFTVLGPNSAVLESFESQIKRLAEFLDEKIAEEVRPDEAAVDCAMRLLGLALDEPAVQEAPADGSNGAPAVEVGNALTSHRRGPGRPPRAA